MDVLLLTVFVSLVLAGLGVGLFVWSAKARTFEHADRLALFLEPTLQSMASFPSIFAPAYAGAGLALLLRMKPVLAGSLADKVAAGLLFLILPLTQDVAAGLGAACVAYVSLAILAGEHVSRLLRALTVLFLLYFFYGFWSIL